MSLKFKFWMPQELNHQRFSQSQASKLGGIGTTRCTEKDCCNFIGSYCRELLSTDDARIFQDYLVCKQLENPSFLYSIDIDDDHCLENVFWIDSRYRVDYQHCGDLIPFDTIHPTNRYEKSFAPFVRVNHH